MVAKILIAGFVLSVITEAVRHIGLSWSSEPLVQRARPSVGFLVQSPPSYSDYSMLAWIKVDDYSLTLKSKTGKRQEFIWSQLTEVQILSCPSYWSVRDLFIILCGETEEQDVSVEHSDAVWSGLMEFLGALPGYDDEEHSLALQSRIVEYFVVWERGA